MRPLNQVGIDGFAVKVRPDLGDLAAAGGDVGADQAGRCHGGGSADEDRRVSPCGAGFQACQEIHDDCERGGDVPGADVFVGMVAQAIPASDEEHSDGRDR